LIWDAVENTTPSTKTNFSLPFFIAQNFSESDHNVIVMEESRNPLSHMQQKNIFLTQFLECIKHT